MTERAVILVAGASRRLGAVTGGHPKTLLEVGGRSILYHQLDALAAVGVKDVTLVVGYKKEEILAAARDYAGGLTFHFVDNPFYDRTNTLYSLYLAREALLKGETFYLNGDVVFDPEILARLATAGPGTWLALDGKACAEEEVKAVLQGERVVQLSKEVQPGAAAGEFLGLARFSAGDARLMGPSLTALVEAGQVMAYFELAVEGILPQTDVRVVDVSDLAAVEIDFPADLETARTEVYPRIAARRAEGERAAL